MLNFLYLYLSCVAGGEEPDRTMGGEVSEVIDSGDFLPSQMRWLIAFGFGKSPTENDQDIEFNLAGPTPEPELDRWVMENCVAPFVIVATDVEGGQVISVRGWFRDPDDAVLLKLRWC